MTIPLSKLTHQIWRDHPFSQRNKTTERAVGVGVGGDREVRGGEGSKKNLRDLMIKKIL